MLHQDTYNFANYFPVSIDYKIISCIIFCVFFRTRKREKTSYRRRSINYGEAWRRRRLRKGDVHCQLPNIDVTQQLTFAQQITIAYSVSNSSVSVYSPWKIVKWEGKSKIFERLHSFAECRYSCVLSTRVWRAWICRRERGPPDSLPLPPHLAWST